MLTIEKMSYMTIDKNYFRFLKKYVKKFIHV